MTVSNKMSGSEQAQATFNGGLDYSKDQYLTCRVVLLVRSARCGVLCFDGKRDHGLPAWQTTIPRLLIVVDRMQMLRCT